MNHVISLEDILGPELAIQAAQDKQFKRLNAIQAGLEAGIPFDMPALAAELGIGSGLNRAMESFYIGDVPKKTMTIALEEVGVVKAGLIAAGIGVLAVILKKIYDWIKNFFGSSSGGSGGGGGGSSSEPSAEAVFEAAKDAKDVASDLNALANEVKAMPEVVVVALNNAVPKDSAEAEKVSNEQAIPFVKALTTTPGTDKPLHIPARAKIKKSTYTGNTSKLELTDVDEDNALDELPSDELEEAVKAMNVVLKWCKEKKVIYVSNASKMYASILSDEAQPLLQEYTKATVTTLQALNEICERFYQGGLDDIVSVKSATQMLGLNKGEKAMEMFGRLDKVWEDIKSYFPKFAEAEGKSDAAEKAFFEFVNSDAPRTLNIDKKLTNSAKVMTSLEYMTREFNSDERKRFRDLTENVYKYSEVATKMTESDDYKNADADAQEYMNTIKEVMHTLTGFIKAVCQEMRKLLIYIRKMCRAVFSVVADVVGVTNMMVDKNLLKKHDMATINKMDRTIDNINSFMEKISFGSSLRKVQHA